MDYLQFKKTHSENLKCISYRIHISNLPARMDCKPLCDPLGEWMFIFHQCRVHIEVHSSSIAFNVAKCPDPYSIHSRIEEDVYSNRSREQFSIFSPTRGTQNLTRVRQSVTQLIRILSYRETLRKPCHACFSQDFFQVEPKLWGLSKRDCLLDYYLLRYRMLGRLCVHSRSSTY
jgi:hypothetical protein